jgi:probable F420-dependent oxidoreductase
MRFSVQLPTDRVDPDAGFCSAEAIAEMAHAAQDSGFDACYVTEHPFPTDEWLNSGGHHALDPFIALSAAATATTEIRLHTNILVLGYRSPFLAAKAIASLDVLSDGRVIAGVGAGYLEGEYDALGADFEARNATLDDALAAMKAAWSGDVVVRSAPGYEVAGNRMLPRPIQSPHPPLWIGGNSRAAMRRAVAHGQGWSPFPIPSKYAGRTRTSAIDDIAGLASKIEALHQMAREAGRREPLDIGFVPFGQGMNVAGPLDVSAVSQQLDALEKIGVTWVSVGAPTRSRTEYLEHIAHFGDALIAPRG